MGWQGARRGLLEGGAGRGRDGTERRDWEEQGGRGGVGPATPGKRAVSSGRGSRCARVCTTSTIAESLLDYFSLSLFPSFVLRVGSSLLYSPMHYYHRLSLLALVPNGPASGEMGR